MDNRSFQNYLEQDVWVKAFCAGVIGRAVDCATLADDAVAGLRMRRAEHLEPSDNPEEED